jgi:hypothetical protein
MAMTFETPRDVVGGLVVVAVGGLFLLFGRELPAGRRSGWGTEIVDGSNYSLLPRLVGNSVSRWPNDELRRPALSWLR